MIRLGAGLPSPGIGVGRQAPGQCIGPAPEVRPWLRPTLDEEAGTGLMPMADG